VPEPVSGHARGRVARRGWGPRVDAVGDGDRKARLRVQASRSGMVPSREEEPGRAPASESAIPRRRHAWMCPRRQDRRPLERVCAECRAFERPRPPGMLFALADAADVPEF
jgi:hypothetical protein